MKGLEEWLASSTSSSSTTDTTSRDVPESDKVHKKTVQTSVKDRQDELRSRMRNLLGESAVSSLVIEEPTKVAMTTSPTAVLNSSMSTDTDSTAVSPARVKGVSPQTKANGNSNGDGSTAIRGQSNDKQLEAPTEVQYRAVEVMVVDRGTQTTTTVGCQTDPEPSQSPVGGAMPFHRGFCPRCTCCCRGVVRDYPWRNAREEEDRSSRFQEELETIQKSIDMMIARYNLPPPPMPRY
ncbi:hypothetical protein, conserved [Trypanosoma brucei brucei TREU927]|uniref:Uncharacterized protein n=1 Tax=Trypanosoma brucei brucei (strain 927/4 GUTat10.1) TaxID=185431 RepID=Q583M8_TRYB2|nr:hypothetical protein, conserved [Trypanosoma brucei brucei TREU927]AAX81009.1 hypothetical protein, conserved [Trypanosoma brucei]AAZ11868.1 hypothetical protein, conserved [Trypanosoma brucei brucei TREU927]